MAPLGAGLAVQPVRAKQPGTVSGWGEGFYPLRMRRAAKRDGNERPIIEALKAMGCSVHQIDDRDAPDLIVGFKGQNYLAEVKDLSSPRARTRVNQTGSPLEANQAKWIEAWNGRVFVFTDPKQAVEEIERATYRR